MNLVPVLVVLGLLALMILFAVWAGRGERRRRQQIINSIKSGGRVASGFGEIMTPVEMVQCPLCDKIHGELPGPFPELCPECR